jgi:hypothetical protein
MLEDELPEPERRRLQRSLERAPLAAATPWTARYNALGRHRRERRAPLVLGFSGGLLAAFVLLTMSTGSASPLVWAASAGRPITWLEAGPLKWMPLAKPSPEPEASPQQNPVAVLASSPSALPTSQPTSRPAPSPGKSPVPAAAPSPSSTQDGSGDGGGESANPSPTPVKASPSPPAAIGSVTVTPAPATIGQDVTVAGSGWTPGSRLVLTLVQGSTSDELSGSVDVSSAGQMSWKGGVPGQFVPGSATLKICYEATTTCKQVSLNLVQQAN